MRKLPKHGSPAMPYPTVDQHPAYARHVFIFMEKQPKHGGANGNKCGASLRAFK
jgi:hypothetical protein